MSPLPAVLMKRPPISETRHHWKDLLRIPRRSHEHDRKHKHRHGPVEDGESAHCGHRTGTHGHRGYSEIGQCHTRVEYNYYAIWTYVTTDILIHYFTI